MSNQLPNFGDNESESGDDWNPLPAVESDDEEQPQARSTDDSKAPRRSAPAESKDESDDEGKLDTEALSPQQAQAPNNGVDQEDAEEDGEGAGDDEGLNVDDDEEEDEDEEDEEEEVTGHRRKRHKHDRRNQFLDIEADVEDEDEEAEDEDDELPGEGFLADTHPDDEGLPAGDEGDDRRHRELDRRRQQQEDLDAEKAAAIMKERYGRNRAAPADSVVVPQRLLLPSVDDPTIWGVRCKPGKEREIVFSLTKRLEDRAHGREPLLITAAFERGGTMAGFVYVEARKQADVLTACDGVLNCYPRTKMVLVPIGEMPDLLRTMKTKSLEPGMYVRIKRGKYQGDLAQVEEVEMNGLEVDLRIVPRLDYGLNEDVNAPTASNGLQADGSKRKRPGNLGGKLGQRPPQRLFSEVEARKKHSKYVQQVSSYNKKQFNYQNDTYIGGFLHKAFKIQFLQTENVNPTLEEVTKFTAGAEDGTENLDLTALAATLKAGNAASSYLPGDMVEIYHGEQRGVSGKAISVHGDIVTLRVTDGDLRGQTIEAPVKGLRKLFREGDHVKIVGGSKYHDEVGMVVRIVDDRVTLLSDSNNQELTVFSKDLRAATDSGPAGAGSKYELYELVQLDSSTVAVVIKVDRESLKVLDQIGAVRTLLPSQISNKIERRRFAVATDKDGTEIRNDDTVREVAGEQRSGLILHVHRVYLFLLNRQQVENSGVFVVRNSAVLTVAAKGGRATGPDLTKMNPALGRGPGASAAGAMPPPRTFGRDRLIGKTVIIRKGPWKGLLGIVKDTTENQARIELHTKNKIITVSKDVLTIKDPITGASIEVNKFGRPAGGAPFAGRGGYGGNTPNRGADGWDGSRTPAMASGGKTPAWGAFNSGNRTPGWKQQPASGSRTPGWADGSRTTNPYADGSRTAYGGATAYGGTSTWNPNSSTPFHTSSGFSNSGSRTPAAWETSSRTPAHRGFDAPTPGFSAPTPSAYSAPTPGADGYGQPTPRGSNPYGAPTPGAFTAETPGAYGSAATPGAVGGDDEGYE